MVFDIDKVVGETIEKVVDKYTNPTNAMIEEYREYNGEEIDISTALLNELHKLDVPCEIETETPFESCGYTCKIIMIAWYNKYTNRVNTDHILIEIC